MSPLTVLFVGNYKHSWCSEVHFTRSIESLGHTVVRIQEDECDWAALPRLADEHGAHLLCWTRTWPTDFDTVAKPFEELRRMGVPTVVRHLDLYFNLLRSHQIDDDPFFRCPDLVVTPHDTDEWAAHGIEHWWQPPGVVADECGPVEPDHRKYPHPVVFVGSGAFRPYPHPEWAPVRARVLDACSGSFGKQFGRWPRPGSPIRGLDLQTLYASAKVVVGDSCLVGNPRAYWSDRTPESLGRGALLLHPVVPGFIDTAENQETDMGFVHGEHLWTYPAGDGGAVVDLVRAALADPEGSQRIRDAGRALVLSRDTYAHRFAALFAHVEERFGWR